jgi:hypothetical protein
MMEATRIAERGNAGKPRHHLPSSESLYDKLLVMRMPWIRVCLVSLLWCDSVANNDSRPHQDYLSIIFLGQVFALMCHAAISGGTGINYA